jgi:hypothetical protein
VPAPLVEQDAVTVRVDPRTVQILDAHEAVAVAYPVPATPTRLLASAPPLDRHGPPSSRPVQEAAFLARFPHTTAFLHGLRHRMTTLTPIHLHALDRLVDLYGAPAVQAALAHAAAYRNFNTRAVERILQRAHPTVVPEPAPGTLSPRPEAFGALDDTDSGSPQDSTLDSMPPTGGTEHGA